MVTAMANKQDGSVGYKRPPVTTQFKPGISGNPSGRPKHAKSLKAELLEELGEVMRVRDGDGEQEISKARAIATSLVRAAVDGNLRAATALLAFCAKSLGDIDATQDKVVAPEDADILDDYVGRELRRRANAHDAITDNQSSNSNENRSENNEE